MKSLFIVETPLQLMNVIEAIHSLGFNSNSLLIILSEPFPEKVFKPLIRFANWKNIVYSTMSHRFDQLDLTVFGESVSYRINEYVKELKQLLKRQKIERLIGRLGKVDNLVLGNYLAGYMRHFANRISPKNVYIVDDGTDTLRANALRREKIEPRKEPRLSWYRQTKNDFRTNFIDWDSKQAASVVFFTTYALDLIQKDRLIKNDYSFFRSRMTRSDIREEIYFLGQPLAEDGYLSSETYRGFLAKIVEYYRGSNLVYLPHKRENTSNVESIGKMGLSVKTFELPIEVEMLDTMPKEVASFFSSALDNSRIIFGEKLKVKAFRIDQYKFNPGCEFVQEFYNYFGANVGPNFEIVPI